MNRKAPHLSTRSSKSIKIIATAVPLCYPLCIHPIDRNRDHMPLPKGVSVHGWWLFTDRILFTAHTNGESSEVPAKHNMKKDLEGTEEVIKSTSV
jgi:hypothetical protein